MSKMVVANIEGVEKVGEQIWEEEGYFGKLNPDYSCHKNDFPENARIYVNQGYLTVKDRDTMIYCDYTILAQIIPFKSSPENIDETVKEDKKLVKIYMPMYDSAAGQFLGVKEGIGYIMVRNEEEEPFLSYGYSSEHSNVLYYHSKQPIPNIFRGTSFNTHTLQTYLENKSICVSIFLVSQIARKTLIGIKAWFHWYLLVLPLEISVLFLLKVVCLIRVIWIKMVKIEIARGRHCTPIFKMLPKSLMPT